MLIIIAVVIAGIIIVPKLFGNKGKQNVADSLTESTSFWIRNNEDLYAMFDINGKQLTGFDFTSVSSEFVNGTAEKIYNVTGTENLYYGTTTIFEVNGKKLLTGKIIWSMTSTTAEGEFVAVEKDNKYTVHNLLNGKDIVTLNSKPNMSVDYFTTSENSKTQYCSYTTGKLFYEE